MGADGREGEQRGRPGPKGPPKEGMLVRQAGTAQRGRSSEPWLDGETNGPFALRRAMLAPHPQRAHMSARHRACEVLHLGQPIRPAWSRKSVVACRC